MNWWASVCVCVRVSVRPHARAGPVSNLDVEIKADRLSLKPRISPGHKTMVLFSASSRPKRDHHHRVTRWTGWGKGVLKRSDGLAQPVYECRSYPALKTICIQHFDPLHPQ